MDVSIEPGLQYIRKVKSFLKNHHDYADFIQVLLDFKHKRTDFTVVVATLKEIFKQNKDLIVGFNAFLSDFNKIAVDDDVEETKIPIEYEECINLVNKIIIHFGDDQQHRFEAFLNVIDMCGKGFMDMKEVCGKINALLGDNPDVLYQILKLLSGCNMKEILRTRKLSYCDFDGRGRLIETGTKKGKHVEKDDGGCNMMEILRTRKLSSSGVDGRGGLIETGRKKRKDVEEDNHGCNMAKIPRTKKLSSSDVDGRGGLIETGRKKRKDVEEDNRGCNMKEILRTRKLSSSDVDGRGELIETGIEKMRHIENNCGYSEKAINFFEKVKKKLCNVDDYLKFLKLIEMYRRGNINRYELEIWIGELFQMDGGLMIEFDDLISSFEDNLF